MGSDWIILMSTYILLQIGLGNECASLSTSPVMQQLPTIPTTITTANVRTFRYVFEFSTSPNQVDDLKTYTKTNQTFWSLTTIGLLTGVTCVLIATAIIILIIIIYIRHKRTFEAVYEVTPKTLLPIHKSRPTSAVYYNVREAAVSRCLSHSHSECSLDVTEGRTTNAVQPEN